MERRCHDCRALVKQTGKRGQLLRFFCSRRSFLQRRLRTYLPIRHHRQIGLEAVRRPIYSIVRQSVLILLDWLLRPVPVGAGVSEAAVGGVVLVLLRRGEGVEVSLHAALGLRVELRLERGQLLGDAEESPDFHAEDHPDHV